MWNMKYISQENANSELIVLIWTNKNEIRERKKRRRSKKTHKRQHDI